MEQSSEFLTGRLFEGLRADDLAFTGGGERLLADSWMNLRRLGTGDFEIDLDLERDLDIDSLENLDFLVGEILSLAS
jgi:hypothetical protein